MGKQRLWLTANIRRQIKGTIFRFFSWIIFLLIASYWLFLIILFYSVYLILFLIHTEEGSDQNVCICNFFLINYIYIYMHRSPHLASSNVYFIILYDISLYIIWQTSVRWSKVNLTDNMFALGPPQFRQCTAIFLCSNVAVARFRVLRSRT